MSQKGDRYSSLFYCQMWLTFTFYIEDQGTLYIEDQGTLYTEDHMMESSEIRYYVADIYFIYE